MSAVEWFIRGTGETLSSINDRGIDSAIMGDAEIGEFDLFCVGCRLFKREIITR